jgi:Regulator of ribonuclease activity B/Family of unknown function (DUF695)
MSPWERDFDVYQTELDGEPASVVVDLAVRSQAPLATHPAVVTIEVPLRLAQPDGLAHPDEAAGLTAIEDHVAERLAAAASAIYVGRVVTGGVDTMYCYVPATPRRTVDELTTALGVLPAGYQVKVELGDDPAWKRAAALAPDALAEQTMWNRRLLRAFEARGDALEVPREVDHMAYFPTRAAAERAEMDLREARFRVDEPYETDDGDAWAVPFHREDALADGRPDEFVAEIFEILTRHGGRYDGWGAEHRARTA